MEWFNAVDATYRADLRERNELNFQRFDAKLEQRLAQLDAKWERRFAELDASVDRRLGTLKGDLMKWMFVFWTGTVVPLAGLMVALHLL